MGLKVRDMFDLGDWQPFQCDEAPPAYSCVALNGGTVNKKIFTHTVVKQDATFRFEHGITSPFHPSGSGATKGNLCVGGMCPAKYGDTSVAVGDVVGPKPGEWGLWKNYPGFRVRDIVDEDNKIALVAWVPIVHLVGKADSTIAALSSATPGSGDVSIWYQTGGSGAWVDSTINITGLNFSGASVPTAKFLQLKLVGKDWLIDFESCT
jgi:hypothetical protein